MQVVSINFLKCKRKKNCVEFKKHIWNNQFGSKKKIIIKKKDWRGKGTGRADSILKRKDAILHSQWTLDYVPGRHGGNKPIEEQASQTDKHQIPYQDFLSQERM